MSLKDKLLGNNQEPLTPEPAAGPVVKRAPASMQDRVRQANKMAKERPAWNLTIYQGDVALLLDDSSSMDYADGDTETKIDRLNEGVQLFADEVDFISTKIIAIPMNDESVDLNSRVEVGNFKAGGGGGTPMDKCLQRFLDSRANQGILISDGEANNDQLAIRQAELCAEVRKRVDCVHIGTSSGGERTLKKIAELTGGMFFKFKDVASFAASLRQLAPKCRAALASKSAEEIRLLTGATEVIK